MNANKSGHRLLKRCALITLLTLGFAMPGHGQSVAEFDAAYEAMLDNPEDLEAIVRFAEIATRIGEYEVAVGALERLLLYSSDLPEIRADLGFLYFRLGSFELARYHLVEALNSGRLPPDLELRTARLIDGADDNVARHSFIGRLNVGLRFQTNANSAPSNDRVLAGGVVVQLNDANQEQQDYDLYAVASGLYRYDLQTQNGAAIEVPMSLVVDRFADQETLHNLTISLNPGVRFEPDPVDAKGITLFPHLLSRVVERGDELLSTSLGVGLGLRYAARDDLFAQGLFRHRRIDFRNSGLRPNASDRDGYTNLLSGSVRYRLMDSLFLRGAAHLVQREADRDFNSSFEWGGSLRLIKSHSSDWLGLGTGQFRSYLHAGLRDVRFSAPDPGVDQNTKRNDHEYTLGLGSTLSLNRQWSVSLEGSATNVTSNIRNFVRDNLSVSLSATYRF
ncbi:MAG: tetratricopeptide repeat protein [Pseudomonadota bacterium]